MADSIARVFRRREVGDSDHADALRYWLAQPIEDRISHVTDLRSEAFGYDDATESRLQRVATKLTLAEFRRQSADAKER